MREVSLRLSCQDSVADVQHDLPGAFIRSDRLTWHQAKCSYSSGSTQHAYDSMRFDARNTVVLRISLCPFQFKSYSREKLILLKTIFLFDLNREGQYVTQCSQVGYGWIQNIPNFPFIFDCEALLQLGGE